MSPSNRSFRPRSSLNFYQPNRDNRSRVVVLLANEQTDIALECSMMAAVCELIDNLSSLNAGVKSQE